MTEQSIDDRVELHGDEIDLAELGLTRWRGRWTILAASLVRLVLAPIAALIFRRLHPLQMPWRDNLRTVLRKLDGTVGAVAGSN